MFRDNFRPILKNENILLLMASVTTGLTVQQGAECIAYYGGRLCGVSAIFSALDRVDDVHIHSLYHVNDLPGYDSHISSQCPACRRGEKLEAIINGFGYFKLKLERRTRVTEENQMKIIQRVFADKRAPANR